MSIGISRIWWPINDDIYPLSFSSDSKARFKLFKKGSGLETIEEEMATCVDLQNSIEVELQRRKEVCEAFLLFNLSCVATIGSGGAIPIHI